MVAFYWHMQGKRNFKREKIDQEICSLLVLNSCCNNVPVSLLSKEIFLFPTQWF